MSADDKMKPRVMEGFIGNGIHVLDVMKKVPPGMFEKCSGVVLLSAREIGFFVSGQKGAGVVMHHKPDGSWSNPIAVLMDGAGFGVTVGYAELEVIVFLSPDSAQRILEGRGGLRLGADMGLTLGTLGYTTGAGVAGSDAGAGLTRSVYYAFSKGALINLEFQSSSLDYAAGINQDFYGTPQPKAILDGTAPVPKGQGQDFVDKLHNAIKKHEEKKETEEKE